MNFNAYIDKAANKLACLGVFNALFIYSLSLEDSLPSKVLSICFMGLSLLLFISVITEAIKHYKPGALDFVLFILMMILSAFSLTVYALSKYPTFLIVFLTGIDFLIFATVYFLVSLLFEKYFPERKSCFFMTDSTFHDLLCILIGCIGGFLFFRYLSEVSVRALEYLT